MTTKNRHAVALGRRGGRVTSPRKAAAARANAAKGGGRPPDYEVVPQSTTPTAYLTKWDKRERMRYPVRMLSDAALVTLAKWLKRNRPGDSVVGVDAVGRVYFGREE